MGNSRVRRLLPPSPIDTRSSRFIETSTIGSRPRPSAARSGAGHRSQRVASPMGWVLDDPGEEFDDELNADE